MTYTKKETTSYSEIITGSNDFERSTSFLFSLSTEGSSGENGEFASTTSAMTDTTLIQSTTIEEQDKLTATTTNVATLQSSSLPQNSEQTVGNFTSNTAATTYTTETSKLVSETTPYMISNGVQTITQVNTFPTNNEMTTNAETNLFSKWETYAILGAVCIVIVVAVIVVILILRKKKPKNYSLWEVSREKNNTQMGDIEPGKELSNSNESLQNITTTTSAAVNVFENSRSSTPTESLNKISGENVSKKEKKNEGVGFKAKEKKTLIKVELPTINGTGKSHQASIIEQNETESTTEQSNSYDDSSFDSSENNSAVPKPILTSFAASNSDNEEISLNLKSEEQKINSLPDGVKNTVTDNTENDKNKSTLEQLNKNDDDLCTAENVSLVPRPILASFKASDSDNEELPSINLESEQNVKEHKIDSFLYQEKDARIDKAENKTISAPPPPPPPPPLQG